MRTLYSNESRDDELSIEYRVLRGDLMGWRRYARVKWAHCAFDRSQNVENLIKLSSLLLLFLRTLNLFSNKSRMAEISIGHISSYVPRIEMVFADLKTSRRALSESSRIPSIRDTQLEI